MAAMMTICLIQTLIPTHPINRVFHFDPPLGEGAIEAHVLGWAIFAARFAARRRAQPVRMRLAAMPT